MIKMLSAAAAAFLLASGAAAAAPKADDSAKEKKICKSQKMTGSLTRVRRICMTRAGWDELRESNQRALDRIDRTQKQASAMSQRDLEAMTGATNGF